MSGIAWISSYPKSGNTWCRAFLTAYMSGEARLQHLAGAPIAGSRVMLDRWLGFPTLGHPHRQVECWRADAYRNMARKFQERGKPALLKVHDWWHMTPRGEPLFPWEATHRCVYLVRDPRDVACSFAHHLGKTVDQAAHGMNVQNFALAVHGPSVKDQVMQTLNTWSAHVESWLDDSELYSYVIRYEDLKRDPAPIWKGMLEYLGIGYDAARFDLALKQSSFDSLQVREKVAGFKEASKAADAPFFRKGVAGGWKAELSEEGAARICMQHNRVMRRLGYL